MAPPGLPNLRRLFADGSPFVEQTSSLPSDVSGVMASAMAFADGVTYAAADGRFYRTYNDGQPVNFQYLQGKISYDLVSNCNFDVGEPVFHNWIVRATDSNDEVFWTTSDSFGNYSLRLDLETYDIQVIPASENWETCQVISSLSLNTALDTTLLDFPMDAITTCPRVSIDIASAELLRCQTNRAHLNYDNQGTATATDAYVLLDLASVLQITDSSIPYDSIGPQQYRFDLGDIPQQSQGSFWVDTYLDCTDNIQGQTFCMTARVMPDTFCLPPDVLWDGTSIEVDASCQNDSLEFVVNATGTNSSSGPMRYVIIEDDVLIFQGEIDVTIGEESTIPYIPNGSTLRLEVEQSPFHPGNSFPSISMEGCGLNSSGSISLGFVSLFPEDDNNFFVATQCHQSYDNSPGTPLEAFPKGYGPQHLIPPHTELDYLIRLQNTTADTVHRIVIYDTLSPFLDPASIQWGASSHVYESQLIGTGVVKITFPNIQLPPEVINSTASKAFVKFRIAQLPGNVPGTVITNQAAFSMDFADRIFTNPTFHQIGEDFIPPLSQMSITGNVQNIIGLPIPSVNLEIPQVDSITLTDAIGQYEFPMLPFYQKYTLSTYYENPNRHGVSAYDLYLLANGMNNGMIADQPYWPAVADADRNGQIDADDLAAIELFVLGNQSMNTNLGEWYFQPSKRSFRLGDSLSNLIPINNPTSYNGMSLTGLLSGDLNGDYLRALAPADALDGELELQLKSEKNEMQQTVTTVLLPEAVYLQSCQFSLAYDPDQHQVIEVQCPLVEKNALGHWNYYFPESGLITFFWYATESMVLVEADIPLLNILFSGEGSNVFSLADFPTMPEAYVVDREGMPLARLKPTERIDLPFGEDGLAVQASPIPAAQQIINIQFGLKEASELSLVLFDASGKNILEFYNNYFFEQGSYEIQLPTSQLTSGTYFLRASSGNVHKIVELVVFD